MIVSRLSRSRVLAVLSVVLGTALTGCAPGGGIVAGTALNDSPGSNGMGIVALPPGSKIGVLNLAFYNRGSQPLTITGVAITGQGLGTVARVTEIKIAPAGHGPGGLYVSDPPVFHFAKGSRLGPAGCNVQELRPPGDFVLVPGTPQGRHNIYIWAVVQMVRPGRYNSLGSTIFYTQGGRRYRDFVAQGFNGSVADGATWPTPDLEAGCPRAHLLNADHQ